MAVEGGPVHAPGRDGAVNFGQAGCGSGPEIFRNNRP